MYKLIFLLLLMSLLLLIPTNNVNASDNITLITNVVSDNVTIILITNVIPSSSTWYSWSGCCGNDWTERSGVVRNIPLNWLTMFPNMMTGILDPETVCNDLRIQILRVEPESIAVGKTVDVVFVAESNCNYVGNVDLQVNGRSNKTLGVDLRNIRNKTYVTDITGITQLGLQTITIKGATATFNVAGNVIPTAIETPQPIAPPSVEKTQDNLIMWVAIAVGAIILVTIILLVILR